MYCHSYVEGVSSASDLRRCLSRRSRPLASPPRRCRRSSRRVSVAATRAVQLGKRLVRPVRDGESPPCADRGARWRRREDQVRRDGGSFEAGRALVARPRSEARRAYSGDAHEHDAAVGDDARRDPARPRRDSGDASADRARPRGPARARRREAHRHRQRGRREADRSEPRRPQALHRSSCELGRFRDCTRSTGRARTGADPRARSALAVLHLGHDRAAQARAAHARELSDRPPLDDVLDRPARRRHPPQHQLAGLGQARVVEPVRTWNAGATILVHDQARFAASRTFAVLRDYEVTRLCAPPTVWRDVDPRIARREAGRLARAG